MPELFSIDEARRAVGAEFFGAGPAPARPLEDAAVDSRRVAPGALFVPMKGERTDGHLYIGEALARGASASLVERGFWRGNAGRLKAEAARRRAGLLVVDSSLAALQVLAELHLSRMPAVTIGITGSSGKTTCKEMVGAILGREAAVAVNEGNLNSEIGLPLAALKVRPRHRFALFEMGMNRVGEMDVLANIVKPRYALVTNIGSAHLGRVGSRDAIAAEKRKIFSRLDGGGRGYVYEGERYLGFLAQTAPGRIGTYGERSTAGFQGAERLGIEGSLMSWKGLRIRLAIPGSYSVRNALGAISLCTELGCSEEAVKLGLEGLKPLFGRGELLRGRATAILDCYNANFESMEGSLRFLAETEWDGRKCAVLGSMMELGQESASIHAELGRLLAGLDLDALFLLGADMAHARTELAAAGYKGELMQTAEFSELEEAVDRYMAKDDLFLLKGSRGTALERLSGLFEAAGA